jgi:microcystin-dependent protein
MKIRMLVVDLELTPRGERIAMQLKRALRLSVPVLVLGVGALAYAGPVKTWNAGEALSAKDLNDAFASMKDEIAVAQARADALVPPGTIAAYAGAIDGNPDELIAGKAPERLPPAGWLLCNGQAKNGLTYERLYKAIGTTFGGNASSQSFNLPELRGYFLRGLDPGGAVDPADGLVAPAAKPRAVGSAQLDMFRSHAHEATQTHGGWTQAGDQFTAMSDIQGDTTVLSIFTKATGGSETRPKNVAVNYIIKY